MPLSFWPGARSHSRGASRARRVRSWLLPLCAVGLAALPLAASAQQPGANAPAPAAETRVNPNAFEISVVVFSIPGGPDSVAVAYPESIKDPQIRQDLQQLAAALGTQAAEVRVEREKLPGRNEVIATGSANMTGLANWQSGAINLDPLIQTYRRYGHFSATFMFMGSFPMQQPPPSFSEPPLQVRSQRVGNNSVSFEVWIDQSRGVPDSVPSVSQSQSGPSWRLIAAVVAILLVVGVSVVLIVSVLLAQRRKSSGEEPR
ncbi:MAG: hypothetical protein ACK47B_10140 [Armatimonadota bacterium]